MADLHAFVPRFSDSKLKNKFLDENHNQKNRKRKATWLSLQNNLSWPWVMRFSCTRARKKSFTYVFRKFYEENIFHTTTHILWWSGPYLSVSSCGHVSLIRSITFKLSDTYSKSILFNWIPCSAKYVRKDSVTPALKLTPMCSSSGQFIHTHSKSIHTKYVYFWFKMKNFYCQVSGY